jgi:hypothetical protein
MPPPHGIRNCAFDGAPFEIPPEGISLTECVLRHLSFDGYLIAVFFARGCVVESCDFRRAYLDKGYFGGGEGAGFSQTVYRDCTFDGAVLEGMSFGSARFERCSFRDVRLRRWLSFSAEFVDCVFAGEIPEAAFLGRPPLPATVRKQNEFRGNDFSQAKFGSVEFRGGIDLRLQRLPPGDGAAVLDRRAERIAASLAKIEMWPDAAERHSASHYLGLYGGSRYDGQEQLYLPNRPSRLLSEELRRRVVDLLKNCLPSEAG